MKKYLLTAALAVVVSGTFVSCHDDEITPMTIDQKKLAFEEAFVRYYGQPDPNHTWGFGENVTRATTRGSINVNGNMWDTCPTVDDPEEVNAIFNYVNYTLDQMDNEVHHKYSTTAPGNIDGYFVTQVRNGKNADNKYTNTYNNNAEVKDVGAYMNHLQIAFNANPSLDDLNNSAQNYPWSASDWNHINNFNASENANYGGNTKVENAGAYDFAYHNSFDSKYHNTWILIDGADITSDGKYKDYLYVCFDFESTPQCTTRFRFNYNGQEYGPIDAAGAWKVADAIDSHLKVNLNGTEVDLATVSNLRIDNIINGDKWVPGDTKYTDWIVRITKGQPKQIPQVKITTSTGKIRKEVFVQSTAIKGGRVMCEDIASNSYDRKDFDYNDVVFDAIIYQNRYVLVTTSLDNSDNVLSTSNPELNYTQEEDMPNPNYISHHANIRLLAAGGTIPLQIAANGHNFEVHNMLGGKSTKVMINTLYKDKTDVVNGATVDYSDYVDLTVDGSKDIEGIERIQDIEIDVKYSQASAKIDAIPGRASAKILTPLGTPWTLERTDISTVYTHFTDWVTDEDATSNSVWNTDVDASGQFDIEDNRLNGYKLEGLTMPSSPSISSTSIWKKEYSSGSAPSPVNATNTLMATPTGTTIYDYKTSGEGYLYDGSSVSATSTASITAGSKIRIYGVSINDWEVTFNNQTKTQSTESSYTTNGYVEFDVTQNLGNSLSITGKNFTITYITVVGATPNPVQIWSGRATGQFAISAATISPVLENATTSNKICAYVESCGSWVQIYKDGWGAWTDSEKLPGWSYNNNTMAPDQGISSIYNTSKKCLEIPLTTNFITSIKSNGLGFNFNDMVITSVTLE